VSSDDSEVRFMLGNTAYPGAEWQYNPNFLIKDARVYNRVLSASDIQTLARSPNNYNAISEGLVFNAPFCRNFRYGDYLDHQLTADMAVLDRVNQFVGTPHYSSVTGSYAIFGRDPILNAY
jgi:hypothetical protein